MTATQDRPTATFAHVGTTKQMTQRPPARLTVAYIRVSTEDQAKEGNSLADQERQTRAYAVARDWGEVADVYVDAGVSGATRDRPGLTRLLADAKADKIGRVIITKLDRMSRKAADLLAIEEELDQCNVERIYIKDSIDTSTPTGRLLRTVLAAVAELERDMIQERTTAGKREAVRRGDVWRPSGVLGYRYLAVDNATGQKGRLEIDEATAPLVRRIFTLTAQGVSLTSLATRLNSEGIPTPRGGAMWRVNTLGTIINNPTYIGQATFGRRKRVKTANGRSTMRTNDPSAIMYIPVPPIVTPELAQAAHAAVARNRAVAKRNAKREYLLSGGQVRCGTILPNGHMCGSVMRGETHGNSRQQYRCSHVEPEGYRRHTMPGAPLETAVWTALAEMIANPDVVLADVEAVIDASSRQGAEVVAEFATLERATGEMNAQLGRLLDLYLAGRLDADTYSAKASELGARKDNVLARQEELTTRQAAAAAHLLPVTGARAACEQMAGRLDGLTFTQRQHLVRTLCTGIIADREKIVIEGVLPSDEHETDAGVIADIAS